MAARALFLDKDGVINVDHGYVSSPERTIFINGIFDLCRAATRHGFLNVVVTNQAGIARGYYTEENFMAYMDWMRGEFRGHGAQLDAVYYCPHHPVHGIGKYLLDCDCRKPGSGMILRAARELDLDLTRSVMLGDKPTDTAAGQAAGVGTVIEFPALRPTGTGAVSLDSASMARVLDALAS
ncbi:MAG TPA: HAD family hydrolase [Rhodanobacteraceae bacterium]|nr:HAD family hydrolase [Rhodanobacteraceae bacterium]